jgi:hypothetical protein
MSTLLYGIGANAMCDRNGNDVRISNVSDMYTVLCRITYLSTADSAPYGRALRSQQHASKVLILDELSKGGPTHQAMI